MELIDDRRAAVFVDYAHTPDALRRTLAALRPLTASRGRLVVVFGCGGDRDRGKRPLMGRAAADLADLTVLTSDNPRGEDPRAIIADIEKGIAPFASRLELCDHGRGYMVVEDRAEAIGTALETASRGDVVVVAGKGHEDYQEIDGRRRPFDDRSMVASLLGAGWRSPRS
jgi:UDP-N-acetylmuramoyl-L-alanyl-D-glutamate--2,6-diaminopimelate ligase